MAEEPVVEKTTLAYRVRQLLDTDTPITISEIAARLETDYRSVFQVIKHTKGLHQYTRKKKTKKGEMLVYAYTLRTLKGEQTSAGNSSTA